ncbi:MAG: DUF192 domain-containing protein [Bdellovibrionales bacterium]
MSKLQLKNITKNTVLATDVSIAESFIERGIGLLGKKTLPAHQALWIKNCYDIHTFFMRFPIDVVFLDEQLKVADIRRNMKPWRLAIKPGANSVIEFLGGTITESKMDIGDQLNVGA